MSGLDPKIAKIVRERWGEKAKVHYGVFGTVEAQIAHVYADGRIGIHWRKNERDGWSLGSFINIQEWDKAKAAAK